MRNGVSRTGGFSPESAQAQALRRLDHHVHHDPLRLAIVVLGLLHHWIRSRERSGFLHCARHARRAPWSLGFRVGRDSIRAGVIKSAAGTPPKANDPMNHPAFVPWQRVLQSKEVWAVTLSYFCYGYVAWIFFSWFYRYLAKVRGLDLKASAFYTMLPFLAMLVAASWEELINDRLTKWQGSARGTLRCLPHSPLRWQGFLSRSDLRFRAHGWPASCSPVEQARCISPRVPSGRLQPILLVPLLVRCRAL